MKKYSDSTLMRMTKADLIEQLRCAEHNQEVAEEALAQQAENLKDWKPVVYCKDCKYAYINSFSASSGMALCTSSGQPMQQDDFCSYGERKNAGERPAKKSQVEISRQCSL